MCLIFFFNDTATTEIYTLSLHDALPILTPSDSASAVPRSLVIETCSSSASSHVAGALDFMSASSVHRPARVSVSGSRRSEEHTSELQSRQYLVCRLLLEKKKIQQSASRR